MPLAPTTGMKTAADVCSASAPLDSRTVELMSCFGAGFGTLSSCDWSSWVGVESTGEGTLPASPVVLMLAMFAVFPSTIGGTVDVAMLPALGTVGTRMLDASAPLENTTALREGPPDESIGVDSIRADLSEPTGVALNSEERKAASAIEVELAKLGVIVSPEDANPKSTGDPTLGTCVILETLVRNDSLNLLSFDEIWKAEAADCADDVTPCEPLVFVIDAAVVPTALLSVMPALLVSSLKTPFDEVVLLTKPKEKIGVVGVDILSANTLN